jgi:hypothetical protein
MSILRAALVALAILNVASCATVAPHQFAEPTRDWRVRAGQISYQRGRSILIGDMVVRFSKSGDLELTISKGPGVTLLSIRQDALFTEVRGALVGRGWAGPIAKAPVQLRGWLSLAAKLSQAGNRKVVRHTTGAEIFIARF